MVFNFKILRQAWEICKNNKFLYIFGLFLVLGNTLNLIMSLPSDNSKQLTLNGYETVIAFLAALVLIVLYYRSKAGLISGIKAILDKKETSFGKSFKASRLSYGRVLTLSIFIQLGLLVLALLIASPVAYLINQKFVIRAVILGVFGSAIFLPVLIIAVLINVIAPMFIVLFDLNVKDAVGRAYEMIEEFWRNLILFGFLMFALEFLALFFMAFMVGLAQGSLIGLLIAALIFLVLESIIFVYQQAAWVILFLDLVKPQKLEEAEPVVAPEIVS